MIFQTKIAFLRILKSEVAQLDEAFNKIFTEEPQQSVIENLKKKHGLVVGKDSKDSNLKLGKKKYERFDHEPKGLANSEKINVEGFQQRMSRARLLDNVPQPIRQENSRRIHQELSVIGQALPVKPDIKVDPSPKPRRTMPVQPDKSNVIF